jgi:phenylpropionate dioxygenase-like ring-hydroxylating dioxygenase large terminal subunit
MLIPDRWYVVLDANEISAGRPLGIKCLGELMVFWRDENGRVVVMKDRCPHRSSQLSLGRVVNGRIQCPFHGFEFDGDGACQLIPANGRNAGVPKFDRSTPSRSRMGARSSGIAPRLSRPPGLSNRIVTLRKELAPEQCHFRVGPL